MEELVEYAGKLTSRDQQGQLNQAGFIPDFPCAHTGLYASMLGGAWFDRESDRLTVNVKPVIEAENWQLQFFNQYGFKEANQFVESFDRYRDSSHPVYAGRRLNCQQCHREALDFIRKIPDNGFYNGKVAMMVDGEW